MVKYIIPSSIFLMISLVSCQDVNTKQFDPIILGDSSLIVTETNPTYLKNDVEDIDPKHTNVEIAEVKPIIKDTAAQINTTVSKPIDSINTKQVPKNNVKDFILEIGNNTTIVFENLKTKSYRNQQPDKLNSLTYQRTSGSLENVNVKVTGGKITSVKQKYTSHVVANFKDASFVVTSLGDYNSGYQTIKNNGNNFVAFNLSKPNFKSVSKKNLQNALGKDAKNKKYNKQLLNKLNKEIKNVQSVNQAPLKVVLKYAVWQINGVDANGKSFSKEIRIDK